MQRRIQGACGGDPCARVAAVREGPASALSPWGDTRGCGTRPARGTAHAARRQPASAREATVPARTGKRAVREAGAGSAVDLGHRVDADPPLELALDHLESAIEKGFADFRWIAEDGDLASLREDARFKKLIGLDGPEGATGAGEDGESEGEKAERTDEVRRR